MKSKVNIATRWKNFEPTKKFVFWSCVGTAALTVFVGFNWGGWVTGGSARSMAEGAATEARVQLVVASCAQGFSQGTDTGARLAALRKTESWMRGGYMEKAGWVTPPGADGPVANAGERCAEQLLSAASAASK